MNLSKKNPSKKLLNHDLWTVVATVGPVGFAARAPGTWGSVVGLGFGYFLHLVLSAATKQNSETYFALAALIFALVVGISLRAIHHTERKWHLHDASCIVIDEVIAQAFVVIWWPASWASYLLGFGLFRLFDIWKPWPVNVIDRKLPGAFGTLFDDLAAGIYATICLALAHKFINFNNVF